MFDRFIKFLASGAIAGGFLVVGLVFANAVTAAEWQVVPSGDPALPYRVQPIDPRPSTDVATFDEAIEVAKELEGLTGGVGSIEFGSDPTATTPTGLCSDAEGFLFVCGTADSVLVK